MDLEYVSTSLMAMSHLCDRMSPFLLLDYNEPYYFEASPFDTGVFHIPI